MALKSGALKAGLKAGMQQEQSKADRFALAERAAQEFPAGLLKPPAVMPPQSFGAERLPAQAGLGRQIVRIPIEFLDDNPLNAREIYDPKAIQERAASMAKNGQKTPVSIAVSPERHGRYILIDGHYRKRAAQSLGWHDIECIIERFESEMDLYRLSYELNVQRESQTALDNALAWSKLLSSGKMASASQISETLGVSESNVAKTLSLLNLPVPVIDLMREHPHAVGLHVGYELVLLARVAPEGDVLAVASKVIEGDISGRDVEDMRKALGQVKPRKSKDISRQYKIQNSVGGARGFIKDWDTGRVMLDLHIPDQRVREALIGELRAKFESPSEG